MAVEQGLCTEAELRRTREELQSRLKTNNIILKDLLIQLGYITHTQADRLESGIKEHKGAVHQIPGYKIKSKLGAGAMAIVYKAKQLSLNRTVAIKVLPKRFSENTEYVERFYKEGQAAAKLNHNNIVQAYDVGEAGGYHYFVMEYVEGKTIYDDLSKGYVFEEHEALDIIIQVAHALAHAHACGLIHRDVKPKNIMITPEGLVKLADMGLAREMTDLELAKTEAGKAYGTPYYIAPEQIRGELHIDGRADIYGLGATLYHMLTGRVPYMAEDPTDVMRKHLKEQLVPPDHVNTSLSAGVSEVIEVMMAKRKQERYSNVEELLIDLEALRNGQRPPRAHEKFDISVLGQLEDGEAVELEEDLMRREISQRYRLALLLLGTVAAVSILIIIVLLYHIVGG
jgi:serine/threonine-protein kinase